MLPYVAMIFTQLTGVIAVLIDGIIASRFIDLEAYSGISLVHPFSSMLLALAGFLSTGCVIVCSKLVGVGKKEEANQIFSLAVYIALVFSALLIAVCILWPETLLHLCGVPLSKYPEFTDDMLGYLRGYMLGIPFFLLIQVLGPVLVMDNGRKLFTI